MWLRLRQICLVARDLARSVDELKEIFGLEVCYVDPGVERFGLRNSLLPIGSQFLEVVAPFQENTAGGRYLDRRGGDGGYMVITQCDDVEPRKQRVAELGVRIAQPLESTHHRGMQLHPKDTGGALFEIDWHEGGEDPAGPWSPAGPDWKPAVRTDVVSRILAAELQSPDPKTLAERWSGIAQIELGRDAQGRLELPLENARLRFVEATDGRGEGLGGVDLAVVDRKRLLEAAEKRGRRVSDDLVNVCGTRFGLIDA